ncbi:hypothetical protein [uncultured Bacteroides sp.]|uniref:hypothetical protein n=1 Tax=uncultured Bacteroides sp. TaxID=162156 RepID=UPI00261A1A13|nr:hypothetical protein [uncultured Bacteroides sp.]
MYLLNGEEKALKSVIKEQRIRIGRGLITITPVSEAGLVPEEDVKKTFESQQNIIDNLSAKNESLVKENEELKAKIAELETHVDDNKDVEDADSKEVEQTDTKEVPAEDEKAAVVQDEKKVSAAKSKK